MDQSEQMKNRIKVFFFFVGTYFLVLAATRITTLLSNKVFDDVPDILYVPTLGLFSGFLPLLIASHVALDTTQNYTLTKKFITIPFLLYALGTIAFGIMLIVTSIQIDIPLLEYYSETGELFFTDLEHHWTFFVPKGITMGICSVYIMLSNEHNLLDS